MASVDGENGENFMTEILRLPQFGKSDTRKQVKDLNKFGMDYEQRYKEALERMKSWAKGEHPDCFSEAQKVAEFIFPELAESEDEKIRKSLIRFLKSPFVNENIADEIVDPWIAWLEKQGEKLDPDNVIEWLKTKVYDDSTYGKALIDDFKKAMKGE